MSDISPNITKKSPHILVRLWPLYLIAIVIVVIFANGWHKVLSLETLRTQREYLTGFVADNLILAVLAYLAIYAAATLFMIPGALWITISGGFLFGLAGGSALTVVGATLGASALFFAAKTSLGTTLQERAGPFVKKMEAGFKEDALSYMFALRFLPVVPYPVANIAPALLGAKYSQYAMTTMLGIIPGVVAYTWIGAGLGATFDAGQTPDLAGLAKNLMPAFLALGVVSLIPVAWKKFGPKSVKLETPNSEE
ncbi:TVP38/TMEM64 family protein [Hirschia litorea]|uniref:TVP38/TMEM64 family membrane protein n=1 Tax=Hirschia litorea TaxID=1199156 RepID=A0ABW2IJZ7_9PROT